MTAQPLSHGATAEIYPWHGRQVVKLFHADFPHAAVAYELQIVQLVRRAGIAAPAIRAVIEMQGRRGLVYDYIDGPTMLHAVLHQPGMTLQAALQFAQAHATIHQHHDPRLPSQHERLRLMIGHAHLLTSVQRDAALAALDRLPEATTICHGDYHPGNILLSRRGPTVIDWIGATHGHPLADVARAVLILRYATIPAYYGQHAQQRFTFVRQVMQVLYLWRYGKLAPFSPHHLRAWMLPIAAARLSERLGEDEINRLSKLVDRLIELNT